LGAKICGNLIATGGNDNHVFIYDMRNPSTFLSGYTHGAAVKSMTWIHDKKLLITGGGTADKKIKFWNNTKSKIVK
jgi:cell division cycle 20-like protein 1 (cofactor of APC complex)